MRGPHPRDHDRHGLTVSLRRALNEALVPETRTGRLLAVLAGVDSCGTGMYLTGAALYFTRVVGLSAGQVGIGLTMAGLCGLTGAVPIGALADRLGSGRVFVVLQVLRGIGFAAYPFVTSFAGYLLVTCALGLLETVTFPLTTAMVGAAVAPETRMGTMAKLRAMRNVGFGLGALAATAAIHSGSRAAFASLILGNALSFFVSAAGLLRIGIARLAPAVRSRHDPAGPVVRTNDVAHRGRREAKAASARYLVAAALNGILTIHMTLLVVGLPLWISQRTRAPVSVAGACVVLNTILAVLLQARLARPATALEGAVRSMRRSGAALACFCALVLGASALGSPVLAGIAALASAVPLTFGELWQAAGEWKISFDLAEPAYRSRYLSTFQLGSGLQQVAGPLVVTSLILPHSRGWLVLGAALLMAGLAFGPLIAGAAVPGQAQGAREAA